MSSEWTKVELGELLEITSSKRIFREDYVEEGIPFFRSKEIIERSEGKEISTELYISREKFNGIKKKFGVPVEGDILLSSVGTLGVSYQVEFNDEFYFKDGNLTWFRNFTDKINSRYLLCWLKSPKAKRAFEMITIGSTQKALTIASLKKIKIPLPSKDQQNQIAKIYDSLSEKIRVNRQINQTLEQIAEAIFKSWFVDFEPVKAKFAAKAAGQDPERAAMCAISGKTASELDQLSPENYQQLATTAALFPDALVESEMGMIPAGWEVKPLAEMVKLIGGGTPKRSVSEYWGGDVPWFSVQDAPAEGDIFVVDTEEKITNIGLEKSSTKLLPVGTTIISARGTVGRLALIDVEMAMNQSCYGVIGADGVGPYFNYFNLKNAVATLQQNTHGAVFDTITRQTFETVSCVAPTRPVLDGFEVVLAPFMRIISSNLLQRRTLANLRDTLLPKLLLGDFLRSI